MLAIVGFLTVTVILHLLLHMILYKECDCSEQKRGNTGIHGLDSYHT